MEKLDAELVIVGSGAAGLQAALTAQEHLDSILLLSKGKLFASGSTFLNRNKQWGITFAETDEEKESLFKQINIISYGTNDQHLSRILVEESHQAFLALQKLGVTFLHHSDGQLHRVSPCFHPSPLAAIITDVKQFATIFKKHLDHSKITVLEDTAASKLLIKGNSICGILAQQGDKEIQISCSAVILATGGNAATFPANIVEPTLTGDGYQLLEQVSVPLVNMEYQQRVWEDIDPLAPRFSVGSFFAQTYTFQTADGLKIKLPSPSSKIAQSRQLHVPISNLQPDLAFDKILLKHLTDDFSSAIQVIDNSTHQPTNTIYPHVQASNGGVHISPWGETSVNGLFAAGEITTGMHGGDRIGGLMITSTQVFGKRAAQRAARYIKE